MSLDFVAIGDICDVKGGKRLPKGHNYSEVSTRYKYLRVADITSRKIDKSTLPSLSPKTRKLIERYTVSTGDVIISIAGTIGVTLNVTDELDNVNLTENAAKLIPKKIGAYDSHYLSLALQSEYAQNQIKGLTGQVTIGKLALFRIEKIQIPLPPLPEQRRIAAILDRADALRQKRRQALQRLDDLLQSVFLEMFGETKEMISLKRVAAIERNKATEEEKESLPYIGLENIEKDQGRLTSDFQFEVANMKATNYRFTPNQVLYGKLRPNLNKVIIPDFDGVCTTEILPITPFDDKITKEYLWAYLNSKEFVDWASLNVSGAQLPRLSPKLLAAKEIPLPPLEKQIIFSSFVNNVKNQIIKLQQSFDNFENLFHSLQHKAFRGEL